MGTNSKAAHATYAISPSTTHVGAPADSDTVEAATSSQPPPEHQPGGEADGHVRDPGLLPVTPIPDTPDVGKAFGEPILVGGADLHASAATLVSYDSPDGPRTVLHALVAEDAEDKLLEALNITKDMVPTQVEQKVNGRLPLDREHQMADTLIAAAKSVNHHLGKGDLAPGKVPGTTAKKISKAQQVLSTVQATIGADPGPVEAAMLEHYQHKLAAIMHAVDTATKVGQIEPFLHEGTTTITVMKPALPEEAGGEHVAAVLRDATRIKPTLDDTTGTASWDGLTRWQNASGREYAIDLGDGFHAVYHPYAINNPTTTEHSLRGRLEIIAPPGEGHGPDVVRRLGQLHLANRPMTREEGEYGYLNANITAQGLTDHAEITQAKATGQHIEEMIRHELLYERAHQAVGMDQAQLARFAKNIQLEAHTRALPAQVTVLRDAVATATGHADGAALAATPGYDPTPRRGGGWLTWNRFDVANSLDTLREATKGKKLVHATSMTGLKAMLATGVLASTERRSIMGVKPGVGKSEQEDKKTGGASSVFLRILKKTTSNAPRLVWDQPERLLNRADYYGANCDTFGAVNSTAATRNPFKIAAFNSGANEIMFGDGIDLLGDEGPSRIHCTSEEQRAEIHAMLTAKGVTHIAGKPIDSVLKA
ncbi:hypothetical protein [Amycolatopsis aidingensis]|uniref:hypothetical protein n=1 Tax=Amycolatopsis aidingensis TaxID=2842453 RepID=UPI001C0CB3FF|nr:hypothetical protein [Amycolatopsis aidingensis]